MGYSKNAICGIYCFKNKINNKLYIGKSISINERKDLHIKSLNLNKHHSFHLQRAWNKYGAENFKHVILKICKEEELDIFENKLVNLFKTNNRSFGYNIRNIDNTYSKETRIKMSNSLKNSIHVKNARIQSWKTRKRLKINQYDLNGKFIKTWNSVKECSENLNINKNGIYKSSNSLDSKIKFKNYMFRKYIDTSNIKPYFRIKKIKNKRIIKKVLCFDRNNNFLKEYKNCSIAALALNLDSSCIAKNCKGKIKYYKQFIFKNK